MGRLLAAVMTFAGGSVFANIIIALGIGFATYTALTAVLDGLLGQLQSRVGGLAADLSAVLAIYGFWEAMSIIASAMTAVAAVKSARTFLVKAT